MLLRSRDDDHVRIVRARSRVCIVWIVGGFARGPRDRLELLLVPGVEAAETKRIRGIEAMAGEEVDPVSFLALSAEAGVVGVVLVDAVRAGAVALVRLSI